MAEWRAWAQATQRIRIGLMVGANTFRNPTLVAKMATTLDHISNGRAILGIGAAWFAEEHRDFGFEFGDGPPERLRWLAEALPIKRGMLDGTEPYWSPAEPRSRTAASRPARTNALSRWAAARTIEPARMVWSAVPIAAPSA